MAGSPIGWFRGRWFRAWAGPRDSTNGAKRVIIAMTHTAKGVPKIVKKCTLPLTSVRRIDLIVTELAVIEPTASQGLVLRELAPGVTLEQVIAATQASLTVAEHLLEMALAA